MRCAVLLLAAVTLLGQSAPPAASPTDPASVARIEGRVLNAVTGEPLRKAEIMLSGPAEYSATSDASGRFVIEKIPPGTYRLTAQHQNYQVLTYGATRPGGAGTRLNLSAGQSLTGLDLKLTPFAVISGKVVDQDGDPVAGVPVSVMKWGYTRRSRQLLPAGAGTSTNDRGEYRIYNLPAGRYFLLARPLRHDNHVPLPEGAGRIGATRRPAPQEILATTFYPSAADPSSAAAIPLTAGLEVPGIDVQLRKTRVYTVTGRVAGIQGRRLFVSLQSKENSSVAPGITTRRDSVARPQDGGFTLPGVTPGLYNLVVMVDNHMAARQEISVGDADLEGLVVSVSEPGSVKGKLRLEDPASTHLPKGVRVSLMPVDDFPMNVPNANTADDGSFAMEHVPADRYRISCGPLGATYLKTIRWNGQVSSDGIVEMSGSGAASLELVFAATSAVIDGDVKTTDDHPAAGVRVLLIPASGRESDFLSLLTDQEGHFAAKGVAPGTYSALALETDIFSMPDPGLVKALQNQITTVTVEENGHATASLKLVPQETLDAVP